MDLELNFGGHKKKCGYTFENADDFFHNETLCAVLLLQYFEY